MPEQPRSPADDVPRTTLDFVRERAGELAEVLETRAERIRRELARHYTHTPVEGFQARFCELHARHVRELRAGRIAPAHGVLGGIHDVSFELEWKEFWTDQEISNPGAIYELADDAFTRGPLICAYMVGDMRSRSPRYDPDPPCLGPQGSWQEPGPPRTPAQKVQAAARCYGLILESIDAPRPE
ncbi:MAG: hypothetical protein AB1941_06575 [Gemmatimonadota bacterium]